MIAVDEIVDILEYFAVGARILTLLLLLIHTCSQKVLNTIPLYFNYLTEYEEKNRKYFFGLGISKFCG